MSKLRFCSSCDLVVGKCLTRFFFLFFHKIRSFDNCDCRESLELGKNVIIYMSACMFMRWKIQGSEHVDMYLWRERERIGWDVRNNDVDIVLSIFLFDICMHKVYKLPM